MTQKDFPRGGKKPSIAPSSKSLLLKKNDPIKARKNRTKKNKKKSNEKDTLVALTAQSLTYSNLCEGMLILGRVQMIKDNNLIISLPGRLSGRVKITDISESYTNLLQSVVNSGNDSLSEFKTLEELFSPGDNVVTYVKAVGKDDKQKVFLSLEPTLVNQNLSSNLITNKCKIVCTISSVEDNGYIVETGIPNVRAFLPKKDIEDDHDHKYFPGRQIMCAVKQVKSNGNSSVISLSLKEKQTISKNVKSLNSLMPGMQLTLSITKIFSNGLQVSYNGDKIGYVNQIHLPKTISQYKPGLEVDGTLLYIIPTVKFAYFTLFKQIPEKSHINKNEIVNGRVLCLESNGILMKLGKNLKGFVPFKKTDQSSNKISQVFAPESDHKCRVLTYNKMDRVHICSTEEKVLDGTDQIVTKISDDNIKQEKKRKNQDEDKQISKKIKTKSTVKQVENETELTIPECGFYWDTMPNSIIQKEVSSSESESEEEIDEQPKQKKKKLSAAERRGQERQKEREIREREEALASSDHMPKSVDQFDRLVLGSPDSSILWIQYMAYHLQATEVDKARAVAKRAIKRINFREEEERLNVWKAWLNLELKFGNSETLNDVFQEAVKGNDAAKVYSHMLTGYANAGKLIEVEETTNKIVKKFKDQPEMWIECGAVLLKVGLKEKSRHIMQRAIQSLPAREHINLIIRFAHLEKNHGDKERSQTLFEQILNTYPKRVDVWTSYVDSLIKFGDIETARRILQRSVTTQVLPPKKMKVLFQKYINFEEKYGNEKAVQNIRDMANDYVKERCK